MHHYFEAITNKSGDSLPGYFARVVDPATQNTVTLAADNNGTPIVTTSGVENAAKTDENGNVSFYVPPGTYHLDIYAQNATSFIMRVPNVAMNSGQGPQGIPGEPGEPGPQGEGLAEVMAPTGASVVGYKQAGTSTIDRTTLDKARERRTLTDYVSGPAAGATTVRAAALAMLADGGGIWPKAAQPWPVAEQVVMPPNTFLEFEDGTMVKWTGPSTGGAFSPVFVAQDNCTIGTTDRAKIVEVYTDTPDRYRYPLFASAVSNVTVTGLRGRNMQHVFCNSASGSYAGVVTSGSGANVCRNIRIFGGGSTYDTPLTGGQSNAPTYIAYTIGFQIEDVTHDKGSSGVQWWGGDANIDGAPANERKCRNGQIVRCSATDVIGGGIWGSMGQNIDIIEPRTVRCHDVGVDIEGGIDIRVINPYTEDCENGCLAIFFHASNVQFINPTVVCTANAFKPMGFYNTGYTARNVRISGGRMTGPAGGVSITSASGQVANFKMDNIDLTNVGIDMHYNANTGTNVLSNVRQRFTADPTGIARALWVGALVDDGVRAGEWVIVDHRIRYDVAATTIAVQIDQAAAGAPLYQLERMNISDGPANGIVLISSVNTTRFIVRDNTIGGTTPVTRSTGTSPFLIAGKNVNQQFTDLAFA